MHHGLVCVSIDNRVNPSAISDVVVTHYKWYFILLATCCNKHLFFSIFRRVSCLAAEKARKQNGGESVFDSGRGGEFLHYYRRMLPPAVHRGNLLRREGN